MFDRVTTIGTAIGRQFDLQNLQGELAKLTSEMASGKKANPVQDLGVGVSLLYKLYADVQQGDAIKNAGNLASKQFDTMQTAMTSIGSMLDDIATKGLQSVNVGTTTTMALLATQARDSMGTITTLLNSQQNGQSVFGGTDSSVLPMQKSDAAGGPLATVQTMLANAVGSAGGPLNATNVDALIAQVGRVFTTQQSSTFSGFAATATAGGGTYDFSYSLDGGSTYTTISSDAAVPGEASQVTLVNLAAKINNQLGTDVAIISGTGASATININAANATKVSGMSFLGTSAISGTGEFSVPSPTGTPETTKYEGLFYQSTSKSTDPDSQIRIGAGETLKHNLRGDNQGFKDTMHALSLMSLLDAKDASGTDLLDSDGKKAVRDKANSLLAQAQHGVTLAAGALGVKQQRLEVISDIQDKAMTSATAQINDLESADYYQVADRINALKIQLQATYSITATLSELSLVNYLR